MCCTGNISKLSLKHLGTTVAFQFWSVYFYEFTVTTPIQQPPNTVPSVLLSTYTVCHYAPQGNILGQIGDKWRARDKEFCSTYNNWNGANKCVNGRFSNCQVFSSFAYNL